MTLDSQLNFVWLCWKLWKLLISSTFFSMESLELNINHHHQSSSLDKLTTGGLFSCLNLPSFQATGDRNAEASVLVACQQNDSKTLICNSRFFFPVSSLLFSFKFFIPSSLPFTHHYLLFFFSCLITSDWPAGGECAGPNIPGCVMWGRQFVARGWWWHPRPSAHQTGYRSAAAENPQAHRAD